MNGPKVKPARRRVLRTLGYFLLITFIPLGLRCAYAQIMMHRAVADTEAREPRWRWPDLIADWPDVPPNQNAALPIVAGEALIDRSKEPDYEASYVGDIERRLTDRQKAVLADRLAMYEKALPHYRSVRHLTTGKFPPPYALIGGSQSPKNYVGSATFALRLNFIDRLEAGNWDAAYECLEAEISVCSSLGDEPFASTVLSRSVARGSVNASVDRWLAQHQPSEEHLAAIQRRLEVEESLPQLSKLIRGERAFMYEMFEEMERTAEPWQQRLRPVYAGLTITHYWKRDCLDGMETLAEILDRPSETHDAALTEWAAEKNSRTIWNALSSFRLYADSFPRLVRLVHRSEASLRCAVVALAAERYRQKEGNWPGTLSDLVAAKLLAEVPRDPFDGKPLKWKSWEKGYVVNSVGADQCDDLRRLNQADDKQMASPRGIRLFDPKHRRQPPP